MAAIDVTLVKAVGIKDVELVGEWLGVCGGMRVWGDQTGPSKHALCLCASTKGGIPHIKPPSQPTPTHSPDALMHTHTHTGKQSPYVLLTMGPKTMKSQTCSGEGHLCLHSPASLSALSPHSQSLYTLLN